MVDTLIIVYAPTLDFYNEDVGHFYSELRDTITKVPRMTNLSSLVTLMPELKVTVTWRALGRHEIGKCNNNRLHLLCLCSEFDLVIGKFDLVIGNFLFRSIRVSGCTPGLEVGM